MAACPVENPDESRRGSRSATQRSMLALDSLWVVGNIPFTSTLRCADCLG